MVNKKLTVYILRLSFFSILSFFSCGKTPDKGGKAFVVNQKAVDAISNFINEIEIIKNDDVAKDSGKHEGVKQMYAALLKIRQALNQGETMPKLQAQKLLNDVIQALNSGKTELNISNIQFDNLNKAKDEFVNSL